MVVVMSRNPKVASSIPDTSTGWTYSKDLKIGKFPVCQWFPNNIRGNVSI